MVQLAFGQKNLNQRIFSFCRPSAEIFSTQESQGRKKCLVGLRPKESHLENFQFLSAFGRNILHLGESGPKKGLTGLRPKESQEEKFQFLSAFGRNILLRRVEAEKWFSWPLAKRISTRECWVFVGLRPKYSLLKIVEAKKTSTTPSTTLFFNFILKFPAQNPRTNPIVQESHLHIVVNTL